MTISILGSDKAAYNEILGTAGQFLSPSQVSILKLSLSMRVYSPKIEMFRQIALDRNLPTGEDCIAVFDVNGELTCNIEAMKKLVEVGSGTKPVSYDMDHHYPGGENSKVVALTSYFLYLLMMYDVHTANIFFSGTQHNLYINEKWYYRLESPFMLN